MLVCKNCQAPVEKKYCAVCGQISSVGRITLAGLIRDLPHAIFHVDKGFLYNFVNLLKRPGGAILEYLEGKRKIFFHPATYLVIALVLNYLVVKITDLHFYDDYELSTMDPLQAQALRDYDAMQWWFLEHTYIYIMISIPLSSLFIFLIMKLVRQAFNLAECAVIVLFVIAEGVLLQSILYTLLGWIDSGPFLRGLETFNLVMLTSYASWAMFTIFSGQRPIWIKLIMAIFAGIGLTVVWVGSALALYYLIGRG